MTDVEKIRRWIEEAKKINTDYRDDNEDLKKLVTISLKLLDACEKTANLEIYFNSSGKMYDPSLGCEKVIFENRAEVLSPARIAIEACAKEVG